jgi:hypothetical protein
MTTHERAEKLMVAAEKLGCDNPTEGMIAEAITDHVEDVIAEVRGWLLEQCMYDAEELIGRRIDQKRAEAWA